MTRKHQTDTQKDTAIEIPDVGPCAGCPWHDEYRGGASCAAGECIEQGEDDE